ncbi:hypothetical protein ACIHCX_33810 [Streptomyces sp. NPDC052043]|uniref:hypothetical protein n=1 Tax=Streptomyces sp. NPDC052043 TaxID=3365684 RepID=UPI0037D667A7
MRSPEIASVDDEHAVRAADCVRRSRLLLTLAVVTLIVIMVVPAVLVASLAEPAPVFMTAGVAAGFGFWALPHACNARTPRRRHGPDSRYLTARTWTGHRTIDLQALTHVRGWREVYRSGSTTYVVATDAFGVRLGFSDPADLRLIRRAVERMQAKLRVSTQP